MKCTKKTPKQSFASVVEDGETLLFDEHAGVTCIDGYSLDASDKSKNEYKIVCEADGSESFSTKEECAPIDCAAEKHSGEIPTIKNAKVGGNSLCGRKLTAKANTGYSLDGTAAGDKTFSILCESSGDFGQRRSRNFSGSLAMFLLSAM